MNRRIIVNVVIVLICVGLLPCLYAAETDSGEADKPVSASADSSPLYLLTYDHGGLVLWGSDHFVSHLRSAVEWL
ncbi:MAG: hypothetical protein ACYTFW_16035, partial [Planctomycetota bacterium]